jgi:hypothetical protein
VETTTELHVRIQKFYLEIELTLVKVEPESQLDDSCGAHPAPEDVLNGGCKTLLKDPKHVTSHQLIEGKEKTIRLLTGEREQCKHW